MRKILLALLVSCIALVTQAQRRSTAKGTSKSSNNASRPKNTSSGRNSNSDDDVTLLIGSTGGFKGVYGILGLQGSYKIAPKTWATAGFGYSSWRVKLGADVSRFTGPNRTGFSYGAGLAVGVGGQSNYITTVNFDDYTAKKNTVVMAQLLLGYGFKLGERSSLHIQVGYAPKFNKSTTYTFDDPNITIADYPEIELVDNLAAPHGFVSNIGFLFPIF